MLLIEKQKVSEWAIAQSIMLMKKVDYYSTVQIAQMMLIKKQKVSEWALLCYAASIKKDDVY